MTNSESITVDALKVIANALELQLQDVPENASIDSFAPWDSLGHMRIIAHLEEVLVRPLEIEEVLSVVDIESISVLIEGRTLSDGSQ